MDLSNLGRWLLVVAALIAVVGLVLLAVGRGPHPRLPGDIAIERKNIRLYFPLGTSILISLALTLLLNLFLRR
jgi:DUF2905 family protein